MNDCVPHQITHHAFGCAGQEKEAGVEEGNGSRDGGGDDEVFRVDLPLAWCFSSFSATCWFREEQLNIFSSYFSMITVIETFLTLYH